VTGISAVLLTSHCSWAQFSSERREVDAISPLVTKNRLRTLWSGQAVSFESLSIRFAIIHACSSLKVPCEVIHALPAVSLFRTSEISPEVRLPNPRIRAADKGTTWGLPAGPSLREPSLAASLVLRKPQCRRNRPSPRVDSTFCALSRRQRTAIFN
jgi:hypothetical protein